MNTQQNARVRPFAETQSHPTQFQAFGLPVPANRLTKAYNVVKEMMPDATSELVHSIVSKTAQSVQRDEPFNIVGAITGLDKDFAQLDLTGRYRLLAEILTD